uniref:Chitin-binding type-2 domain-containing protein n=1 Tax=Anopheles dirus TaxID=7168 RepID=A0A182NE48_9DIPT
MALHQSEFVMLVFSVLVLVPAFGQHPAQQGCPVPTRPHTLRCDQYFRCALLPSKTAVWITTQCRKGLVYRHNLSTCVVPDNDWDCDLAKEFERNRSEESIYGTDNLQHQQAFPPSRTPPATVQHPNTQTRPADAKRTQYQLPTIAGDDRRGILILMDQELNNRTRIRSHGSLADELDASGAGTDGQVIEESNTNALPAANGTVVKSYSPPSSHRGADSASNNEQPPPMPFGMLSTSHLNSILSDYAVPGSGHGQSHKTKLPLPANGKIHPEHLTQIINQQKQLNRIATQMKQSDDPTGGAGDFSPFTNKLTYTRKPVLLNDYPTGVGYGMTYDKQHLIEPESDQHYKAKSPYVSEDIIKSILQISQQMIANHQKTTPAVSDPAKPDPELQQLAKPILLPFSTGATLSTAARPAMVEYAKPVKPQVTTTFNSKPIGISFTNPYTLGHSAVYDNMRNQPLNASTYYNSFQSTLYDIYGNRFVPKDPYAPVMPQRYPQYNAFLAPGSSTPLLNMQPIPTYPSVVSPYVSPPQGPAATAGLIYSQLTNPPPLLQLQSSTANGYDVTGNGIDSFERVDSTESYESADNDTSDSEQAILSDEVSDESSQVEADSSQADPDPQQEYSQYKDSIMPLLDANPSDVRISVVSCTLGSREPNRTDCFKYFVCNPHNGAFQSFTCPSFTAFNKETRLCDTASYHACKAQQTPTTTPPTVIRYKGSHGQPNTHLMKNDLLTAQKYVELIRQEANKLITRNSMQALPPEQIVVLPALDTGSSVVLSTVRPSVKMRRKSSSNKRKHPTPTTTTTTTSTTTTTTIAPATKRSKSTRKGPRCRTEGRIPNPANRYSYYVCHRKSQKKFVKMKMTCPSGLVYCAASQYCSSHC